MAETGVGGGMRLDRFLWFARLTPSRSLAQQLAQSGHLRIDGRSVTKPAAPVRIGNVLTFATPAGGVRVVRIATLPIRRGPSAEARACYIEMIDMIDAAAGQN